MCSVIILNQKLEQGQHVDSRDVKKHRNDILRIAAEMVLEHCELSDAVKEGMVKFMEKFHVTDTELKNLKITGVHAGDIIKALERAFNL